MGSITTLCSEVLNDTMYTAEMAAKGAADEAEVIEAAAGGLQRLESNGSVGSAATSLGMPDLIPVPTRRIPPPQWSTNLCLPNP